MREVIQDGQPTACAREAAFAYVDAAALTELIEEAYADMKRRPRSYASPAPV